MRRRPFVHRLGTATTSSNLETAVAENSSDDDDDEEYEYIEIERLTERDFAGSEWLIGTNWDNNRGKIEETWLRCAVDQDGNNVAIWGDDSKGKWSIDIASGFFSASKESLLTGKKIWATTADDYYFMQGTVRGWSFVSAANVMGQWQARRLGVDKEEAGVAPWFEESEESDESDKPEQVAAATETADVATTTTKGEDKLEQGEQVTAAAKLEEIASLKKDASDDEQALKVEKEAPSASSDAPKANETEQQSSS